MWIRSNRNRFSAACVPFILLVTGCAVHERGIENRLTIAPDDRQNIILVTISSLRADHVGCLGYHRDTTMSFDRFAGQGVLFTNAFASSSWQMPAIGSIFTSRYPREHGAIHVSKHLNPEVLSLAEILNDNGFCTAGFCCNPRISTETGFARGFELFDDYSPAMMLASMSFGEEEPFDINKKRTNDLINDAVFRWLQNNTHRPFFLFVHYYDVHWDYLPPSPYDTLYDPDYEGAINGREVAREPLYSNRPADEDVEHIVALYDGEITQTDQDLGELLHFLETTGRFDNSLIIITGDHGEQFYEHGHTSHHGVFDELLHVPLAVRVPGQNESREIDAMVSGMDLLPTILDYAGISPPSLCRGESLRPKLEDRDQSDRGYIVAEYTGGAVPNAFTVRFSDLKLIQDEDTLLVYDLNQDPSEQHGLALSDVSGLPTQTLEMATELLKEYVAQE